MLLQKNTKGFKDLKYGGITEEERPMCPPVQREIEEGVIKKKEKTAVLALSHSWVNKRLGSPRAEGTCTQILIKAAIISGCLAKPQILSSSRYLPVTSAQRHGSNYIIQDHNTPAARQHRRSTPSPLLSLAQWLSLTL